MNMQPYYGRVALRPKPEATRRAVGAVLYVLGMLAGLFFLVVVFVGPMLASKHPDADMSAMLIGAIFALPPLAVYLWIPWIIDRYDPEPWWCLLLALSWGAIAACGFSALINTGVHVIGNAIGGAEFGDAIGACISAPIVEEFMKGLAVFGVFYFLRREFDGIVDGVIYATFAALGFAAIENIIYYGAAAKTEMLTHKDGILLGTFVVRGILAPWGHPLYTSMTGIGFGIARETNKTWLKWLAPAGGYLFAVLLHSTWNTAALISNELVAFMLPLWFLFVLAFLGVLIWLVRRKGRIIRDHLKDEVLMGHLTPWELDLVTSPVARLRATFSFGGSVGRKFIDVAARLALSKWHARRATQGRKLTISADLIVPLRQELHMLRAAVSRALGRPVPLPRPWTAPPSPYAGWQPPAPQAAWPGQGPNYGPGYRPVQAPWPYRPPRRPPY
ncbi:MAG: PrsW family intramembrane metalloprotease [Polyangiaceae bacterium]|nr:PrsW family intramembrane metalloprotease [Polyangiaceae bacterium]